MGADGPVRMLGLDEPGLVSGSGNNRLTNPDPCGDGYLPVTDKEFDDFQRFGFNSVRLGISWANMEPEAPAAPGEHAWNEDVSQGRRRRRQGVHLTRHRRDPRHAREQPVAGVQEPQARPLPGQRPAGVAVSRCGIAGPASGRVRVPQRRAAARCADRCPAGIRGCLVGDRPPIRGQQAGRGRGHLQRAERSELSWARHAAVLRDRWAKRSARPIPNCY